MRLGLRRGPGSVRMIPAPASSVGVGRADVPCAGPSLSGHPSAMGEPEWYRERGSALRGDDEVERIGRLRGHVSAQLSTGSIAAPMALPLENLSPRMGASLHRDIRRIPVSSSEVVQVGDTRCAPHTGPFGSSNSLICPAAARARCLRLAWRLPAS